MKTAHTVQKSGLFAGADSFNNLKKTILLLFLAISVTACANEANVKYLGLENEVLDTEQGFTGSEARMEVTQRVSVEATSMLEEDTGMVQTQVTIANASQRNMRLLYRGCPVQIQVFDNEKHEGDPIYDSFVANEQECVRREVVRTLFVHEDLSLMEYTHVNAVFTEYNPNGRFYVMAIVRPNGIPVEVPAGEIDLGGDVESWQAYEGK